jgi:hypothetical protein
VFLRVRLWISHKKSRGILESTASKKQKPWVPQFAYPWFQSVSGSVRLLRPTGRLTEKKASPKIRKAKVKKPVGHLILSNKPLSCIAQLDIEFPQSCQ